MTVSSDRISVILTALGPTPVAIKPTQTQINAGFVVAKAAVMAMVQQLVPPWAMGMVSITDAEIHAISDAVVRTTVNTK
jgi:hypothetical protein